MLQAFSDLNCYITLICSNINWRTKNKEKISPFRAGDHFEDHASLDGRTRGLLQKLQGHSVSSLGQQEAFNIQPSSSIDQAPTYTAVKQPGLYRIKNAFQKMMEASVASLRKDNSERLNLYWLRTYKASETSIT